MILTVDAQIIQDTEKFKMDLVGGLERTLSGKVKPSIFAVSTVMPIRLMIGLYGSDHTVLYATSISVERSPSANKRCSHPDGQVNGKTPM